MPPMKVIHIYKDFDVYNGLIETFLLMAKQTDPRRVDFRVCVFGYRGSPFGEQFRKLGGRLDSLEATWEDNPYVIYKLYRYLRRQKPDVVQTYVLKPNLYGRVAAKLARVPVVISTELTLRNQAPTAARRVRDLFFHPLNGHLNRHTDLVMCASEAIKRQWDNGSGRGRFAVVYPPFDVTSVPGVSAKKTPNSNGSWVIGTVGRLSEEKRHIDLLGAFEEVSAEFPKARLLIVGDGYLREDLESVVEEKGLQHKVTFAGFQDNVFPFLREMDVFVLPSRTEGSPISILEAMAAALPVVSTDVGGIPELVVDGETGMLVKPGHPLDLAKAIIGLLSDPKRMRGFGEKGRERVFTHFHPESFVAQLENIYYELALVARRSRRG